MTIIILRCAGDRLAPRKMSFTYMKNLKQYKICDVISFVAVLILAALFLADFITYIVLGELVTLVAVTAVDILFLTFALFAWRQRLPVLWLAAGGTSIVLLMCMSYSALNFSWIRLIQIILCFAAGISALVFQIIKRIPPEKLQMSLLAVLVLYAVFLGAVWGGNVATVKGRIGAAQNEIWGVPNVYTQSKCAEGGTVEKITYDTKAYATDGRSVKKSAYVYLPYNYSENEKYNILYLLHGTGDREDYWLVKNFDNKTMVDNLISRGDIAPLIIVTPTWYTEDDCLSDPDKLTYAFCDEFRNDLMPAVESRYSTYSDGETTAEAFTSSRDYRAFAGLSRGAATTYRSAYNNCLDYVSWFGAFSGCLTSAEEFKDGALSAENSAYSVNYFYNTTGSFDFLFKEHLLSYRWLLENDVRLTENKNCSFDVFPLSYHSMQSWQTALYNALQLFF